MTQIPDWLSWALVSTLFYGIYAFLFRRLIMHKGDTLTAMVISPAIVSVIAAAILGVSALSGGHNLSWLVIIFALLQGGLFFLTTESRATALSLGMPSTQLYPIVKSGTLFVILISALLFNELEMLMDPRRIIGIIFILISVFLILQWKSTSDKGSGGYHSLAFAFLATFTSIGATLAPKYVIDLNQEINIFVFILIANLFTTVLAFFRINYQKQPVTYQAKREASVTGIWLGISSFAGFATFLKAIESGPLSIVAAVSSLYILIPIVLSVIFFKEVFRTRSQIAVILSILGIILCK